MKHLPLRGAETERSRKTITMENKMKTELIMIENRKKFIDEPENYLTIKEFELLEAYSLGANGSWNGQEYKNTYYTVEYDGLVRYIHISDLKGFINYFYACMGDEAKNIKPSKRDYDLNDADRKYIINLLGKISLKAINQI